MIIISHIEFLLWLYSHLGNLWVGLPKHGPTLTAMLRILLSPHWAWPTQPPWCPFVASLALALWLWSPTWHAWSSLCLRWIMYMLACWCWLVTLPALGLSCQPMELHVWSSCHQFLMQRTLNFRCFWGLTFGWIWFCLFLACNDLTRLCWCQIPCSWLRPCRWEVWCTSEAPSFFMESQP